MMRIRNIAAAAVLSVASAASQAAGLYAGIWQSGTDFLFVNHNGDGLIVTTLTNVPVTNIFAPLANGQYFYPSTLDLGDLVSGTLVGNSASLTGTSVYRACNIQISVTFTSPTTLSSQIVAAWPTAAANAQNINCESLRQASISRTGLVRAWAKVF